MRLQICLARPTLLVRWPWFMTDHKYLNFLVKTKCKVRPFAVTYDFLFDGWEFNESLPVSV